MTCSKRTKNKLWWLFVGLCFGLTPYIFQLAEQERGYKAIGGELIFPFIPLIVWCLMFVSKDLVKSIKERLENCDQM